VVIHHEHGREKMDVYMTDGDHYAVTLDDDNVGAACIFESHHGWHNVYRVVDLAVAHGLQLDDADTATMTVYRSGEFDDPNVGEFAVEISESAEHYLNTHLMAGGWSFGWHDGDFYLASAAWWELDG
jgi:hypothetical protein